MATRLGDWVCPRCRNNCFASRTFCKMCGTKNPHPPPASRRIEASAAAAAAVAAPPPPKPGDWNCPTCKYLCFANKTECPKCRSLKPDASASASAPRECIVCMDEPINTMFLPCKHLCVCAECAHKIFVSYDPLCPKCRTPVTSTDKVFTE